MAWHSWADQGGRRHALIYKSESQFRAVHKGFGAARESQDQRSHDRASAEQKGLEQKGLEPRDLSRFNLGYPFFANNS